MPGSDPRVGPRRSGPLTARRLLRFRSARSTPRGERDRWSARLAAGTEAPARRGLPRRIPKDATGIRGTRGSTAPVRCTRRCSVSDAAVAPPKKNHDTSAQPRRAGTSGSSSVAATTAPEGAVTAVPLLVTDFAHARKRGTPVRHPDTPRRVSSRTPRTPKGGVGGSHLGCRCGRVAPIPSQRRWRDRPRARQTSSPFRTVGTGCRSIPSPLRARRQLGRRSRVESAVVSTQAQTVEVTRRCVSATAAPKCPWPVRAEARAGWPEPKPEPRPFPTPPKRHPEPRPRRSGDGVERVDVHVKERVLKDLFSR